MTGRGLEDQMASVNRRENLLVSVTDVQRSDKEPARAAAAPRRPGFAPPARLSSAVTRWIPAGGCKQKPSGAPRPC